jgi:cell division septum initiation protein DivIVA
MPADPNELEHVVGLCRRLLRQNEDLHEHNKELHAQIEHLCGQLRWLGGEWRELTARLDRTKADHAVVEAAYDAMLASTLDEPPSSTIGGRR